MDVQAVLKYMDDLVVGEPSPRGCPDSWLLLQ